MNVINFMDLKKMFMAKGLMSNLQMVHDITAGLEPKKHAHIFPCLCIL